MTRPLNFCKMAVNYKRVEAIYDTRRGWTDVAQNLAAFGLLGQFRKTAVAAMEVGRGATVLDLCCGAGGNIKYIEERVGPEGKIIAWDLSAGMLKELNQKIQSHRWDNVLPVRGNAEQIGLTKPVDAIVSTYSMSIVPDHKAVMAAAAKVLRPGGRIVIFDRCLKTGGPVRTGFNRLIGRGGARWHADWTRRPWEDLRAYFDQVEMHEVFFGLYYIAWGTKQ